MHGCQFTWVRQREQDLKCVGSIFPLSYEKQSNIEIVKLTEIVLIHNHYFPHKIYGYIGKGIPTLPLTRFNGQVLRSQNASPSKLRAEQGVKAIVSMQISDSFTFTSCTLMVYRGHRYWRDRQEHATWAWTPCENYKLNLLHSSPWPPGQAILPPRRHEEPQELLTSRRCWEDAILCPQGSRRGSSGRSTRANTRRSEQTSKFVPM